MTNSLIRLDRANRLRWRARLLEVRAVEVVRATRDQYRGNRILERAKRNHLRADAMLHGFTLAA